MSTKLNTKKLRKNRTRNNPSRLKDVEKIANELDVIARRHLPDGVIGQGVLKGHEAEIRQEALIMAISGFLEGNTRFQEASNKRDRDSAVLEMERCMAIALRISKTRLASRLSHSKARMSKLSEANGGSTQHPSCIHPTDWPSDVKVQLIMRTVGKAVNDGKLSLANATIVSLVCERSMTVDDVASTVRITRSAVYQQIHRVCRVIPELMECVEVDPF